MQQATYDGLRQDTREAIRDLGHKVEIDESVPAGKVLVRSQDGTRLISAQQFSDEARRNAKLQRKRRQERQNRKKGQRRN